MRKVIIESPYAGGEAPSNVEYMRYGNKHAAYLPDGTTATGDTQLKALQALVIARNLKYLDLCLADSLRRGEAPYASHAMYPRVLNDAVDEERAQGIQAGFAWHEAADAIMVYSDYGISIGMQLSIQNAVKPVEYRKILDSTATDTVVIKGVTLKRHHRLLHRGETEFLVTNVFAGGVDLYVEHGDWSGRLLSDFILQVDRPMYPTQSHMTDAADWDVLNREH